MKAVRFHGRGDVRVDDVDPPAAPEAHEVQIEVLACGLCGTDAEEFRTGPHFIPTRPHPLTGRAMPLTIGHEFAGLVVQAGGEVRSPRIGDLVAISPDTACGRCRWCRGGRPNLCAQLASLGLHADGGLAERCNVPAANAVVLPDGVSPEAGALIETVAIAVAALRRGRLAAGDRVAVIGGGAVGLLCAQAARASGAHGVVVVEPLPERIAVGQRLGLEVVPPDASADLPVDLVIECSGAGSGFSSAMHLAGPGGRVVVVGIHGEPRQVDLLRLVECEIEVIGSMSYLFADDYTRAAGLVGTGEVDAGAIVTSRVPLARAVSDGLLGIVERPQDDVKVVVVPHLATEAGA